MLQEKMLQYINIPRYLRLHSCVDDKLIMMDEESIDISLSHGIREKSYDWPRSYGSWIYNYLCNRCLSPLVLWVRLPLRARCTTLCDKVCQWLATGRWFSPCPLVCSTNKTDRHDITEILLKVALNTIKQTKRTNKIKYKYLFLF